ncbi:RNA polymerase subunit sigma-24 [Asanoa ishikariensis]|uniref:RNA polymerase sigma-70 factor, sigma-E family n=1 Tax=Asanoa ishikariensis TaxID=137265 RepID=A0A1H3NY24_9ACTN|nr:SigE family RNA polymerase sigma factor [Asanoa ishikariensis]GIF68283.1 RNA polymerase subunit sigma-24 [Asanoa ishikariensis]SDY93465.1 RNA polymerase sigma-70 factor, sigma-E family [Asanoa ishikariensis]
MTFEEYVGTRGPALVRLARLLTGDRDRADDLVQEVLGQAFVRWRSISRMERPEVYLRRMLVNANASWWRRSANHERPTPHEAIADAADRRGPVHDVGTAVAEWDALWRLLLELPRQQRAVLALRYYEDLDDATIATILGCSASTVRTHALRATQTLRQTLLKTE